MNHMTVDGPDAPWNDDDLTLVCPRCGSWSIETEEGTSECLDCGHKGDIYTFYYEHEKDRKEYE